MCSISVAPMPSMISMPVRLRAMPRRVGTAAPRPRRRTCVRLRQVARVRLAVHHPVRGRRGEADASPDARSMACEQASGGAASSRTRGGADAHREEEQAAEPEGEGERRAADEDVVRGGLQRRAREAVADRQHVAVEMHRALRLAGGARGEGDQRDVVGRGVDVGELGRGAAHALIELGSDARLARAVEIADPVAAPARACAPARARRASALIAQRERDPRLVDDDRELARAQQRHGGDRDAARLEHGEPAGGQHRVVGRAQQHAVAGHQAEVVAQHVGDAVRLLQQLARRSSAVGRVEHAAGRRARASTARSSSSVAQFRRAGYCSSGRSKLNSGQSSRGGRWSRAKVSTCAVSADIVRSFT